MSEVIPVRTSPGQIVEAKNKKVLNYVASKLRLRTTAGQCILHLNTGGEIRKIEWRSQENVDDVVL